ncbi:MAG: hypothetical protein JSR20_07570 [Nitrospira sp.]|nr:hypothetical protein [Nitrospira sp.]
MELASEDILQRWSNNWITCLDRGPSYVFPGDVLDDVPHVTLRDHEAFIHSREFELQNKQCLHLGLLPQPYIGNLEKARLILLGLNPGCNSGEYYYDRNENFRNALVGNIRLEWEQGGFPFIFLNPEFAWHSGFAYWTKHLKGLIETVQRMNRLFTYTDTLKYVSQRIACIELIPYHSIKSPSLRNLRLQSTDMAIEYLRGVLKARVSQDKCFLLALRQRKQWCSRCPGVGIDVVKNAQSGVVSQGNCHSWKHIVDIFMQ